MGNGSEITVEKEIKLKKMEGREKRESRDMVPISEREQSQGNCRQYWQFTVPSISYSGGAQMFKNARWRTVEAGEVIYSCEKDIFQLNFIMEGLVHIHTCPGRDFTVGRWGGEG